MTEAPIFIGGLSGSGKTQLRQALESHPRLSFVRRTRLWSEYHGRFGDLIEDRNRLEARRHLISEGAVSALEPDWDGIFSEFEKGVPSYARLFGVIQRQHAEANGCARWGEQYGGIVHFAEEIFNAYPEARMIHMIRHPRSRARGIMVRRARRPGWIGWETANGLLSARLAQENDDSFGDRYLVLSYESFREHPTHVLSEVCDFLNEDPHSIMESAILGEIRFDPVEDGVTTDALQLRVEEFIDRVVTDWPSLSTYSSRHSALQPRITVSSMLKFPSDTLAMIVRLGSVAFSKAE